MASCPQCCTNLKIRIYSGKSKEEVLIGKQDTFENLIRDSLIRYWKWIAEGKKEYRKEQYYYDPYHNYIEYLGNNVYKFRIQTFDSPEGDEWETGKVMLRGISNIELIKNNKSCL